LPDTLVNELTYDRTEVADTIKAAAVLNWSGLTSSPSVEGPSFSKCPIVPF